MLIFFLHFNLIEKIYLFNIEQNFENCILCN